ncbi:MAG: hypothetical protein WAT35_09325 [Tabrizicola sp.]|uniref:hypothetical protein n=1 Tax=Tabrizicola sp. TaxID=2005166 RepID=UPI003BB1D75C|nr:hypothetical protein [Tabrizicola sp.]
MIRHRRNLPNSLPKRVAILLMAAVALTVALGGLWPFPTMAEEGGHKKAAHETAQTTALREIEAEGVSVIVGLFSGEAEPTII